MTSRTNTRSLTQTTILPSTTVQSSSKPSSIPLPKPLQNSPLGTPFERSVWRLTAQIPPGSFSTYGILAAALKSSPRAVGNALKRNPFAPEIPCHRVLATGNMLGGFKGKIGHRDGDACASLQEKRALLQKEGVRFDALTGRALGTPFSGFVL